MSKIREKLNFLFNKLKISFFVLFIKPLKNVFGINPFGHRSDSAWCNYQAQEQVHRDPEQVHRDQ